MDIQAFFEEVYPPLFRYCQRLTADPDLADDIAQETFLRLLDRKPRGGDAGLRAWTFRVATNLIRDGARQQANRGRLLAGKAPPEPHPSPEVGVEREEKILQVRRVLDTLNPRDREILLLREEGLSYREIAEIIQVAPGSVGTLLARALGRFKIAFHEERSRNATSG